MGYWLRRGEGASGLDPKREEGDPQHRPHVDPHPTLAGEGQGEAVRPRASWEPETHSQILQTPFPTRGSPSLQGNDKARGSLVLVELWRNKWGRRGISLRRPAEVEETGRPAGR